MDFWNGKSVFLTGHTGFKGAWACLVMEKLGARLHGYALAPDAQPNLFDISAARETLTSHHEADLGDLDTLKRAVAETQPDVILHFAAQSLVRKSYVSPLETYAVNVMGTAHVLEAARALDKPCAVVIVTTDKVYENLEWTHPYRENDGLGGSDPYSSSKACSEIVTSSFRRSFFGPGKAPARIASARAGNVIGGGDWAEDRLIPDCIRAFAEADPVVLRNPQAVRPWQHALDPVFGYMRLAQKLYEDGGEEFESGWNFGPDIVGEASTLHIAESIARHWGEGAEIVTRQEANQPKEANILRLDSSKARLELDWRPVWNLPQTLEHTVDWYSAWNKGADMRGYSLDQLDLFLRDLSGQSDGSL